MSSILDQSCTTSSSYFNNEIFGYQTGDKATGETFFPSITAKLDKIIVTLDRRGSPTDNLGMRLYNTSAHLPTTLIKTSDTILDGSILTSGEHSFYFSDVILTSGVEYAFIVLRDGAVSTTDDYTISRTNGTDDYAGYRVIGDGVSSWSGRTNYDQWFEEYYTPSPTITGIQSITGCQSITF